MEQLRAAIHAGKEGRGGWLELAEQYGGLVKPDIVFFGESLPKRFRELRKVDLPAAQVLIIMGTSLQVTPFCDLVHDAPPTCPRLLCNMELVGMRDVRERRNGGLGLLCGEVSFITGVHAKIGATQRLEY